MKKINKKGFAISTVIYGILILFVIVMSVLISTLNFRYKSVSDITGKVEAKKDKYIVNIGTDIQTGEEYVANHTGNYEIEYIDENGEKKTVSTYVEIGEKIKIEVDKIIVKKTVEGIDEEIIVKEFDNLISGIIINGVETTEQIIDDVSNANIPDLRTGLVPVKYDDSKKKWIITSASDPEWYDYNRQKWANAVSLDLSTDEQKQKLLTDANDLTSYKIGVELKLPTLTSTESDVLAMFVWIPRFSYTIGCKDSSTKCWGYKLKNDNIPDKLKNGSYYASYPGEERPGMIDVKFVTTDIKEMYEGDAPTYRYSSTGNRVANNWYTHPAFWWDKDNDGKRWETDSTGNKIYEEGEELSGIWVGKFETSVNTNSTCYTNLYNKSSSVYSNCGASKTDVQPRIMPNVLALVTQNISNQFYTSKKFTQNDLDDLYDLYRINGDAHLSKNSEWGAIMYLSQSIYGKYGNNMYGKSVDGAGNEVIDKIIYKNNSGVSNWARYTGRSEGIVPYSINSYNENGSYQYDGQSTSNDSTFCEKCGTGASSTGNIYGIYDLSGGAMENIMALYPFAAEGYVEDIENYWGYHILTNDDGTKVVANNPGFKEKPEKKYYDEYSTYELYDKSSDNSFEYIGHATAELNTGENKVLVDRPWVVRGGNFNHGQSNLRGHYFTTGRGSGSGLTSFRTILVYTRN